MKNFFKLLFIVSIAFYVVGLINNNMFFFLPAAVGIGVWVSILGDKLFN